MIYRRSRWSLTNMRVRCAHVFVRDLARTAWLVLADSSHHSPSSLQTPVSGLAAESRVTALYVIVLTACLIGCGPPAAVPNRPGRPHTPPSETNLSESSEPDHLSADRVAAIRAAIRNAGGTLACDARGRPVAVDLVSGRVAADRKSFQAALVCPSLKSLRLHAGQLKATDLNAILDQEQLEELLLQEPDLPETFLRDMAERLVKLRRLTIRGATALPENSLRELKPLSHLESLALIDMPLTDESLRALAELPRLRSLDLRQCSSLTPDGLRALLPCRDLEELKLSGSLAGNKAVEVIAGFPALRRLVLEDGTIDDQGLAALVQNAEMAERLEAFQVARCLNLTDQALLNLARLPQLRHLALRDVPVTGAFLAELPQRSQWESLALNQTFLDEQAFEALAGCRNLKRLELVQNLLTAEAINVIAHLGELEYLDISQCGVTDDQLAPLAALPHLKTLIAEGNPGVSPEMIRRLTTPRNS